MNVFWTTLVISTLGIIGGVISSFLTTYFTTKAQYTAMSEEIGKITDIVEGVKKTFQDDTERLKSQLNVLTNKHNILFAEEKEALLAYLSAWNIWNSHLEKMVSSFLSIEEEEESDWFALLDKIDKENDKANDRIQICVSKLELFMTDGLIIKTIYDLNYETQQFQFLNENYIDARIDSNIYLGQYVEEHNFAEKENNKKEQAECLDLISEETDKKTKAYQEYNISLIELEEKIDKLKAEFIMLSKEYIRKGIL
ncbi:MAG: hypothetical protein ACTHJT_13625 [Cytophaga sp.]|uniref:hypothetical protein n=1 Tax=Cytophaga sp. TaxID=29535 RepID=UPI003F7FD28A